MAIRNSALILALLASQAAWADLTVRYQFDFKFGAVIPAEATAPVQQQLATMFPNGLAMRVKGQQCSSSFGPITSIFNGDTKEITLLNPMTRQYTTVAAADYTGNALSQIPIPPEAAKVFQNLKIDAKFSKTGQTETIQGIQAEDNLVTISLEIPNPTGVPIVVRMEIHDWLATDSEVARVPALSEYYGCSSAVNSGADPAAMLDKVLAMFPGMQEKLGEPLKQLVANKKGPALRVDMGIFVPAIAMLLPPQPNAPPIDPSAPLVKVAMNVTEFSQSPIPADAFQIPAGYQAVPMQDLMKAFSLIPGGRAKTQPPAAAPASPRQVAVYTGATVKPGNGVSNPIPINRPAPQYDESARRAKVEGGVLLSLVIDPEGHTRNIKVVRSLHPGLDQKAIEAVNNWTFKPGMKDGQPVAVQATVEVTFRLLDPPTAKQ